jgi:hypothetical protein
MGSQYSAAQIEKMSAKDARKAQVVLVDELAYWESALAGVAPPDQRYYSYTASVEERRRLIAQIRDKLLLNTVEKMDASTETLQSSTTDLVSGVKKLGEGIATLNDSVISLESTTKRLIKSSTRIEYLTMVVVLATISSIAITLMTINIIYSVVVSVAGLFAAIRLWQKISKHPAFQPDDRSS